MINSTRITISFFGKNQIPYLMIIKEDYIDNVIAYAKVIYEEQRNESEVVITGDVLMKQGEKGINLYAVLR